MSTVYEFVTPPVKGSAFTFYVALTDQSNTDVFKANPTLAAGDAKVDIDGGGLNNLATLPAAIGSGKMVSVSLSAAEMNGNVITVLFSDAAGDEWQDLMIVIRTTAAATVSDGTGVTLADDAITAAKIATDAIGSDAVAASALTELIAALLATATPGAYASGSLGYRIGQIGTAVVTVTDPVDSDVNVTTYQGDDYNETDGRELEWSSASWPVLTSATIKIYIHKHSTILTGNVHTGGVGTQIVQLELTAAQSAAIDAGEHSYQAVATLSSGRVVTLAEGVWTSKRRYS